MKKTILIYLLLCIIPVSVFAQNDSIESKPNIKEILFSHISNDYEFHVANTSIPLPVIVYSKSKGLHIFMSSKFHHKTQPYKGFEIALDGNYKGLVVERADDGSYIRPFDFSITRNVFSIMLACLIVAFLLISAARKYKRNALKAPSGIQALIEPVVLFMIDNVIKPTLGDYYKRYAGYLLTVFFMILTLNLMGLIPIAPFGANVTGNINVTASLAFCTLFVTLASSGKEYWMHKLWTPGVPGWVKGLSLMPVVETISIFTGPFSLTVRLFANILAGHMIVIVLTSIIFVFNQYGVAATGGVTVVSLFFSAFMLALDVLVSFIQAYVFTLLSTLFIGGAKHP